MGYTGPEGEEEGEEEGKGEEREEGAVMEEDELRVGGSGNLEAAGGSCASMFSFSQTRIQSHLRFLPKAPNSEKFREHAQTSAEAQFVHPAVIARYHVERAPRLPSSPPFSASLDICALRAPWLQLIKMPGSWSPNLCSVRGSRLGTAQGPLFLLSACLPLCLSAPPPGLPWANFPPPWTPTLSLNPL